MAKIAHFNDAFSDFLHLEASPVEVQSLRQEKITKRKKKVKAKKKTLKESKSLKT